MKDIGRFSRVVQLLVNTTKDGVFRNDLSQQGP